MFVLAVDAYPYPCTFAIHISAYEIIHRWFAKHVHASHAMFTGFCEFILAGCVVGTSYPAIESALVCASLPFGELK